MKKSILLLFVVSIFTLSCSNEAVDNFDNQSLELNKSGQMADLVQKLSTSQEFRNMVSSQNMHRNSNGEGNGVMILQSQWGIFYGALMDNSLYLIGGSGGSIDHMPNGRARFRVHTNNPSAAVLDFSTFSTTYSSDCIEGPLGSFNYNYISEYIVEVFEPIPGVVFTFYTPTGENASAESRSGHCNVSDAQPILDENFEIIGCTDATDFKVMRLGPSGISLE